MDDEFIALSRAVLALCSEMAPAGAEGEAISTRAICTALACKISAAKDPGLILALAIRDLTEAAMRGRQLPPPRRRARCRTIGARHAVR
jgi:hypothetical protein